MTSDYLYTRTRNCFLYLIFKTNFVSEKTEKLLKTVFSFFEYDFRKIFPNFIKHVELDIFLGYENICVCTCIETRFCTPIERIRFCIIILAKAYSAIISGLTIGNGNIYCNSWERRSSLLHQQSKQAIEQITNLVISIMKKRILKMGMHYYFLSFFIQKLLSLGLSRTKSYASWELQT